MKSYRNRTGARRHLDARLGKLRALDTLARPPKGWVKAIREALNMSTAQLARRMGISQPSVAGVEQSESAGRIQLDTLQRAAEALNCRLVYALVPNESLETTVRARARRLAIEHLGSVDHTMTLEDQSVKDSEARERQIEELAEQINARALWDEPENAP
jgi:predicted DNA-binding mobile mystery protein A